MNWWSECRQNQQKLKFRAFRWTHFCVWTMAGSWVHMADDECWCKLFRGPPCSLMWASTCLLASIFWVSSTIMTIQRKNIIYFFPVFCFWFWGSEIILFLFIKMILIETICFYSSFCGSEIEFARPPRMFGPARCRPAKCFAAVAGRWEVPSLACCLLARLGMWLLAKQTNLFFFRCVFGLGIFEG